MTKKTKKTVVVRMDKELADKIKKIRKDSKAKEKKRIKKAVTKHFK